MRTTPVICLLSATLLLGGCFNRDDHPAKDADPSKPSLQMQKPDAPVSSGAPAQQPVPAPEKDN
ncbi:hypothetical protein PS627_00435 [Pseudomonas fluorescens]|uniref:hypothetical protein n=1 Tax=Pseudomonas fluorescens TaxID=294 RepID=UPI001256E451|nr:hypothetical protein [Pseudomonas fluorescens]CAG8863497.1 hypothetical protein PS627_00435 [Pseudomonas fluorescens]